MASTPPTKPRRGRKPNFEVADKPQVGGARPGSGRKPLQRLNVIERLNELDYDPINEMVRLAIECKDPTTGKTIPEMAQLKFNIDKELLSFCAAKQKTIEERVEISDNGVKELLDIVAQSGRPKPGGK